ncbi:ferritin-like domain-containing protein [Telmatobacter sp. DSM 110680]|uniref:Ferritin-like domain-containing protein n=1 Tax=Telmatobacter sp. DSM 110680 TaxID=3036704 RepID=A0AAU7DS02_9BACT
MKMLELNSTVETIAQERLARRKFLTRAGLLGLGAAASFTLGGGSRVARADETESAGEAAQEAAQAKDTVKEIFTAALIAEDLASTFYYNGLVGPVIQDPNLAGPGGSAKNVTSSGNAGNVQYLQAALTQEIHHAGLFRSLLGMQYARYDPVQTFYFPHGTFDTLSAFTGMLNALENAFIGAYLNAIQEFAAKSANKQSGDGAYLEPADAAYTTEQLNYFAKVSASIMGIEAEHRVLGRVISNSNPANNLNYEGTDGINAVYNGPKSAVAALTPFLTPSTGPGYSFTTVLNNQASVSIPIAGWQPSY